MSRKIKYTPEEKIQACRDYLYGKKSALEICQSLGLGKGKPPGLFWKWIASYKVSGEVAFIKTAVNKAYSKEFKMSVVEKYIEGAGSLTELTAMHGISSVSTLNQWVLLYNSDMELKDYDPKQEVYMASARRKTTTDERKEIVIYCIEHLRDYKGTAEKYDVSYSQVYSWVKKYDDIGEEGLTDKRGRHKADEEVDELEKLRRENKRLKRQLEERDMTVELLKKVKEFERRRF